MIGAEIPRRFDVFQHQNLTVVSDEDEMESYACWSKWVDKEIFHYVATVNPISEQNIHIVTKVGRDAEKKMGELLNE